MSAAKQLIVPPIVNLGLSAGKFRSDSSLNCGNVHELLLTQANKRQAQAIQEEGDADTQEESEVIPSPKKASFFRQFIQVHTSQADEKPTTSTHAVPKGDRAQPATGSFFRRFLNSSEPASIPETKEDNRSSTDAVSSANKSEPSSDTDRYSIFRFVEKEGSTTRSKELASKIQSEVGENANVCENATHTSGDANITPPPSSPVDLENTLVCEECKARVLIHMMPEHTDFHFAQRLQQEWNREQFFREYVVLVFKVAVDHRTSTDTACRNFPPLHRLIRPEIPNTSEMTLEETQLTGCILTVYYRYHDDKRDKTC
ncbi:unnamed protein product [Dibothriocephalus latus]|uniref:UBZ3-type domain-containing protein n=1 Tax=Dibothriocephalus latus TaxID=60516 RepID=A0A3P7L4A1_DIBLA|nr:unnamed protein product [Dibothriocephalus latus]